LKKSRARDGPVKAGTGEQNSPLRSTCTAGIKFKEDVIMTKLDVHWEFDGKQYKGTVEFKKQGNETFISFSNESGHVIENGTVSAEVAEEIKNEIVARNCDMTDFEIF